jgi:hypothetical protein
MDTTPDPEDAVPADGPETRARLAEAENMSFDNLAEAQMKLQAAQHALNSALLWAAGKGLRLTVEVSDEYLVDQSQTATGPCPVVNVRVWRA